MQHEHLPAGCVVPKRDLLIRAEPIDSAIDFTLNLYDFVIKLLFWITCVGRGL